MTIYILVPIKMILIDISVRKLIACHILQNNMRRKCNFLNIIPILSRKDHLGGSTKNCKTI